MTPRILPKNTGDTALAVKDLTVEFHTTQGVAAAVENVSFSLEKGKTLALVGESGSGKSVTARALMGLVGKPGRVSQGNVFLGDTDILALTPRRLRALRGNRISMVFQDSLSALNPVFTVGHQLAEIFRTHWGLNRTDARGRSIALLERVRIPDAARRFEHYPHQFSGGMRQRAMIAMSIALDPDVLIADEPTTALDVTVQAQIMDLLAELQAEHSTAMLLITHDLGVVAQQADRVAVMYAGKIVEEADTKRLFRHAAHGYTKALLDAIPTMSASVDRLTSIPGSAPGLGKVRRGCAFAPRCTFATAACEQTQPEPIQIEPSHTASCHEWKRVMT